MRNELRLEIKRLSKKTFDEERSKADQKAKYREKFTRGLS